MGSAISKSLSYLALDVPHLVLTDADIGLTAEQAEPRKCDFCMVDVAGDLGIQGCLGAARSRNLIDAKDRGLASIQTPGGPKSLRILTAIAQLCS